jgi:cbb3-type cytochrome oxidase subunit 3
MIKQYLITHYKHTDLSSFGLILFFTVFTALLIWVYRNERAPFYDRIAGLPFDEGQTLVSKLKEGK